MKRKLCLCLLAVLLFVNAPAAIPLKGSTTIETKTTEYQAIPSLEQTIIQQYKHLFHKATDTKAKTAKKEQKGTGVLGVFSLVTGLFGFFVAPTALTALVLLALAFILGIAGIQKGNTLKVLAGIGLALGAVGLVILLFA